MEKTREKREFMPLQQDWTNTFLQPTMGSLKWLYFSLTRFRMKFNSKRLKMLKGMMIRAKEKYLFSNLRLKWVEFLLHMQVCERNFSVYCMFSSFTLYWQWCKIAVSFIISSPLVSVSKALGICQKYVGTKLNKCK